MSQETWQLSYKEVKNMIHNEIGVTKEDILEVFRQIAKSEIQKILSENNNFIYESILEVIRDEMIKAVDDHRYPKVAGAISYYGYNGKGENSFKDYISGVMKEEIVRALREQFDIQFDINKKEP